MNKKLISMLLAVLMVISMFSGLSVSAYADETLTTTYTMKQGDTVLKVCQSMGINYYTCKNAIMKLNGFTSDTDFRFIPVGKEIIIPVSNAAANEISSAGGSTGTGSGSSSGSGTAPVVPATGDTVAYYLIPHTMLRGETVISVCNALGINYGAFANSIQAINGLSSLSSVKAGQTILLPVGAKPGVGTNCYAVMAHKVVSGETAYTICGSYGVSYNGNLKALQALNGTNNLNYITAGSTFYLPVATTITAETPTSTPPAGTGTGSSSSGSSDTGSSSGTGSTDTGSTKTYALKSNSGAGGIVTFYVKNKAVTAAAAGDIVTVSATPDNGYAIKTLKVVYADGSAEPKLSGNTFVMPTSDVTANVEFSKGYSIKKDCSYTNGLKVLVDGIESSSAQNGAHVLVASNNPALAIDGKVEIYKTENGAYVKSVEAGKSFDMPGYDITVKASMRTVTTYGFFKTVVKDGETVDTSTDLSTIKDPKTGSFVLQVNGSAVSRAAEGTTVTVMASPAVGYAVSGIYVFESNADGKLVNKLSVRGESFTMPANAAHVVVSFAATSSKINIAAHSHGIAKAYSDAACTNVISYAETEKTVFIKAEADVGFTAEKPVVTRTVDGTLVEVTEVSSGIYSFTMPGGGAEVQPQFVGSERVVKIEICDEAMQPISSDVVGVMINDAKAVSGTKYPEGSVLRVREITNIETEFVSFEVVNTKTGAADNDLTKTLNESGTVLVPAYEEGITIRAYFKFNTVEVGDMFFGDKWMAMWVAEDNHNKQVTSYPVGSTGVLLVNAEIDNIELVKITNKATGAVIGYYDVTATPQDNGAVKKLAHNDLTLANSYYYPNGVILALGVNNMPAEGVNVEIKMGNPISSIMLDAGFKVKDASGAEIGTKAEDYDDLLTITGASYHQDMKQGFERKADVGATENVTISSKGAEMGLVLTSIKYTDANDEHYVEAVNGVCSFTVPKSNVTITEANTVNVIVNTSSIKTALENVSVRFYDAVDNAKEVSSYRLGDTVWFRLSVTDKYTLESVKVINLDDNSVITCTDMGNGYYEFELSSRNVRIEAKATNLRTIKFVGNMIVDSVIANVDFLTNGKVTWTLDKDSNTNNVYVANAGDTFKITFKKDVTVPTAWVITDVAAADVKISGQTVYFTVPAGAEGTPVNIDFS